MSGGWVSPAKIARGRVTVFCFPFAGGGASLYRAWAPLVQKSISLCPVQLPGREERFTEKPFERMEDLVAAAAGAIAPFLDHPWALFGHSMGAMIAFELAHLLRERGAPAPRHLFVSGSPAPPRAALVKPLYQLPEEQFIEEVRRFGGLPEEVLRSRELVQLLLPRLRADLAVTGTYAYTDKPPLSCPITAFGGDEDHVVSPSELEEWRDYTIASFHREIFRGGHFFLADAASAIVSNMVFRLGPVDVVG